MTDYTVKTGADADAKSVSFTYDVPTTISSMVEKYGEETAHEFMTRAVDQAVQNVARVLLKEGKSAEDIQKAVNAWIPGVRGPINRKSPLERATNLLGSLSKEELAELVAKVKAAERAAGKNAS